jgi:hypothetical protein
MADSLRAKKIGHVEANEGNNEECHNMFDVSAKLDC